MSPTVSDISSEVTTGGLCDPPFSPHARQSKGLETIHTPDAKTASATQLIARVTFWLSA